MASSRGFNEGRPRPQVALNRSNSEQLLLRKGHDWNYLDMPSSRPTPRDRKAMSDAAEAAMHAHALPPQRMRSATAVIARQGNDQSVATTGGVPFRLNRKEKLFLIKRAKESSMALIDHAHTLDGPIQWHYKGKHRGIQMYRGEGLVDAGAVLPGIHQDDQALEYLCGVTTMMGTLEEVSEYFDQATTARMKMKKADDVLDCAVLNSLVWGNTVNPFHRVSVKYVAYEGPAAMTRPRDYCYLECQDTFRHASGRRGWVLSMHSIKIPSCPEVAGFVRGSVYHSGFVFVEAERPGYMDVMYSLQINFKGHGHLPHFMLNSALKRRLRELIHISREIQVARMAHRTLLDDKELMPKNQRSTCVNCSRRFWLFLRKTRCRVCGEVVCQSCAPEVDWEGAGSNGKQMKTRICVKCYSTAPSVGSWSAPNEKQPWTEASRIVEYENNSKRGNESPKHHMQFVREESDEEEEEDEQVGDIDDEGGRYTFAELEVQSSHSVFAPERFTRSSMASIAPLIIDEIGVDFDKDDDEKDEDEGDGIDDMSSVRSSEFKWHERATEDSVFDPVGSLSGSVLSRDSYFGQPDATAMTRFSIRNPLSVADDTPILMEEPDENQVSHVNTRISRRHSRVGAPPKLPPSEPKQTTNANGAKSSYDYLDGLIDLPIAKKKNDFVMADGTRKRAQTTIRTTPSRNELNPSTLRAHNLRYLRGFEHETPASSRISFANRPQNTPSTPDDQSALHRRSDSNNGGAVCLDDLVASVPSSSSFDGAATNASVDTNSLFSRPSSLILQQVRRNRARTITLQQREVPEETFRTTKEIQDKAEEHRKRMAELNAKAIAYTGNRVSNLGITRPSLEPEHVDDEVWRSSELMEEYRNRRKHTIEALRRKAMSIQDDGRESSGTDHTAASSARSSSFVGVYKLSESSRSPSIDATSQGGDLKFSNLTRQSSAGDIARGVSEASARSPTFIGRKTAAPSELMGRGTEDLTFKPSVDAPLQEFMSRVHEEGDEDDEIKSREPEGESSPLNTRNHRPTVDKEFVSARSLYAEIGHLTQLHSEIATADDSAEVDRIKERIQEQYQLIRHLQLKS